MQPPVRDHDHESFWDQNGGFTSYACAIKLQCIIVIVTSLSALYRPSAGRACWNITIQPLQTNPFNPFTAIQSLNFKAQTPGQGL